MYTVLHNYVAGKILVNRFISPRGLIGKIFGELEINGESIGR